MSTTAYVADGDTLVLRVDTGQITRDGSFVPYQKQPGDELRTDVVWRDGQPYGTLVHTRDGAEMLATYDIYAASELDALFDAVRTGSDVGLSSMLSVKDSSGNLLAIDGLSFKSKIVDTGYTTKWNYEFVVQNEIFIHLDSKISDGQYHIELAPSSGPTVAASVNPASDPTEVLHVSYAGFDPDDPVKKAYASAWMGTAVDGLVDSIFAEIGVGTDFHLVDASTGTIVYTGDVSLSSAASDISGRGSNFDFTDVYELDFSTFELEGTYRLKIDGIGVSHAFDISEGSWMDAAEVAMKGFYNQRSGIALKEELGGWERPRALHPDDGFTAVLSTATLMDTSMGLNLTQVDSFNALAAGATDQVIDGAWGGWHDAGDWDRRVQHLDAARQLLSIAEMDPEFAEDFDLRIPEAGNGTPDVIDEAMWAVDLYSRLQFEHGGVSGGIESAGHPLNGETSWTESQQLYVYAPDAWSSYEFAATAAKAARLIRSYDAAKADELETRAERAMAWAEANTPDYAADVPRVVTSQNLAAVELYRLTGDQSYHDLFQRTSVYATSDSIPWDGHQQEAVMSYRQASGEKNQYLLDRGTKWLLSFADRLKEGSYGQSFDPYKPYGWGNTSSVPSASEALIRAHQITGDQKYLDAIYKDVQFGLGANPDNMSYTTGLGERTPGDPLIVDAYRLGGDAPAGITIFGGGKGWFSALNDVQEDMFPTYPQDYPVHETYIGYHRAWKVTEYSMQATIGPVATAWTYLASQDYDRSEVPQPNMQPIAANETFRGTEGAAIGGNVLANDFDPDGDALVVTGVNGGSLTNTLASGATVTMNADGSFFYRQNGAFEHLEAGQTATDSFTYAISDGRGGTSAATVTITIDGADEPNSAPLAAGDSFRGDEGTAILGAVLANDSDPEGHAISVTAVNAGSLTTTLASGATVAMNPDGTFSYQQNGAFDHLETEQTATDSFTYTVTDAHGASSIATVAIVIDGRSGPNLAPAAADDAFRGAEGAAIGGGVLANDSNPDGDAISVLAVNGGTLSATLASGASVTMNSDGTFSYVQNNAFDYLALGETAVDSFTYTIADEHGAMSTATVEITIDGVQPDATLTDLLPRPGDITGTAGADDLRGVNGSQAIFGFSGDDTLSAKHGSDTVVGGAGSDRLRSDKNKPTVFYFGTEQENGVVETDTIDNFGIGIDSLNLGGGAVASVLEGSRETVLTLAGDGDQIVLRWVTDATAISFLETASNLSTSNSDLLPGGGDVIGTEGSDDIRDGEFAERNFGARNTDRVYGGGGADMLVGGAGNNKLWGGDEADTFVFQRVTSDGAVHGNGVVDWEQGDKIRLIDTSIGSVDVLYNGIFMGLAGDDDEIWVKRVYSIDELAFC